MDDREFSSPVCYLDYDNEQLVTPDPALCAKCKRVMAGFDSVGENFEGHTWAKEKFFESTIDLSTISTPACFLCHLFFKHVPNFPEEFRKLNTGSSVFVEYIRKVDRGAHSILLNLRGDERTLCNLRIIGSVTVMCCLMSTFLLFN
jgi:hypothetical protein